MPGTTSNAEPVHEHTFSDPGPDSIAAEASQLEDPAKLAVSLLIDQALKAAATTFAEAGADGVVAILVSTELSWILLATHDWKRRGRCDMSPTYVSERMWGERGSWVCWTPEEPPGSSSKEAVNEAFSQAVSEGKHAAALVGDLCWLPPDVRQGADVFLTLMPLNSRDISFIARRLSGHEPTMALSDEEAAALTPRLLRWARRPGQSADAYIEKLKHLLKSGAQTVEVRKSSPRQLPTLDRLHGMDEAVAWGRDVARDLTLYRRGEIAWVDVDRGCLLSGPPGCGKTLFARGLATTCEATLITGSYGQWLGTGRAHQGDLLKAMKNTFNEARAAAPAVLFIDEVDSLPNRGTVTHHYAEWEIQVVNALLAEIDGVEGREGVILLAACNYPEKLDPALVRSGRLDRHIRIKLPDRAALVGILREHLGSDLKSQNLDDAVLAADGSSGADCERLVRGARRRARSANRQMVLADLMEEIGGVDDRSAEELWLTAVHEAGHAIVAGTLLPGCLQAVSIQSKGLSQGTTSIALKGQLLKRASDIKIELMILLAGRAAEEEVFGVVSSGSGGSIDSDLGRSTSLAVDAALALGLDRLGGLVWRGRIQAHDLRTQLTTDVQLAEQVRNQLDEAYSASRAIVTHHVAALLTVASALVRKRVLQGRDVELALSG
ncbi:AAA family ATPase [Lichenicoccus roseus]|uniref:AAA family ATPase n=1 Tax=Lichenicoccus roseus TaxID=2683649 RepID=A0A5R9J2W8_9PROT|nr:AAA family ATPase [Lichenicoccus roseus]TLU71892.1 AAA family ATPase [Lichenicoccus roseus]